MSVPGATLVVFNGLPGVGKSPTARLLSVRLRAVYLRVDTIEQAIRSGGVGGVGPAGYEVANRLAVENLRLGRHVVADCAKPCRGKPGRLAKDRVGGGRAPFRDPGDLLRRGRASTAAGHARRRCPGSPAGDLGPGRGRSGGALRWCAASAAGHRAHLSGRRRRAFPAVCRLPSMANASGVRVGV